MKKILLIFSVLLGLVASGCYQTGSYSPIPQAPPVQICTLSQSLGVATITCGSQVLTINQVTVQPFCPGRGGAYYSNSSYGTLGFLENYIQIGMTDYAILDTGNVNGTYLTNLAPGNYNTSDNTGCNFSVNSDGSIHINN